MCKLEWVFLLRSVILIRLSRVTNSIDLKINFYFYLAILSSR